MCGILKASTMDDKKEKTKLQKMALMMAGKELLAVLGKPNASDADVMKLSEAMNQFEQARSFYRYGH